MVLVFCYDLTMGQDFLQGRNNVDASGLEAGTVVQDCVSKDTIVVEINPGINTRFFKRKQGATGNTVGTNGVSGSGTNAQQNVGEIWAAMYDDIHHLASRHTYHEKKSNTIGATALIHETYIRLSQGESPGWENKDHFLACVSTFMNYVLTDHARSKNRLRRGGGRKAISLEIVAGELSHYDVASTESGREAIEALRQLQTFSPVAGHVAYHRFVLGLTAPITAKALGISERTVKSKWAYAKAWLRDKLSDDGV